MVAFTTARTVLTYLAATWAFPLQDVMMERLDGAIGFDWWAWYHAVLDRPILVRLLVVAYNSMSPQVLLAIIYFSPTDRSARIEDLLVLAGATVAATALISAIWPTLGPYAAHGARERCLFAGSAGTTGGWAWHFELWRWKAS